jgi:Flp pilus assembly pilin Flp
MAGSVATAREWARGQGIVEYGLMLGLVAVFTVVILVFFGQTVAEILAAVGAAIDRAG